MSELNELYQEIILEHSKAPRNYRRPAGTNRSAEGYNPQCADHFTIFLDMEGDSIRDVGFQGSGCAISKASASMLTQSLKGKTRAEAERLFDKFHGLVTGEGATSADGSDLGKLAVFSGVSKYPARVNCATLAWLALQSALEVDKKPVTTEEE